MQRLRPTKILHSVFAAALIGAVAVNPATPAAADEIAAYTVEVNDVTAKVGETAVLLATLRPRDGYKILHAYNNRVGQLSSWDDGVTFEKKVFPAQDEDGALVFEIRAKPTSSGAHPINGVFRVGYVEAGAGMSMISVPLKATITGTN
jgi:hypothetical protein